MGGRRRRLKHRSQRGAGAPRFYRRGGEAVDVVDEVREVDKVREVEEGDKVGIEVSIEVDTEAGLHHHAQDEGGSGTETETETGAMGGWQEDSGWESEFDVIAGDIESLLRQSGTGEYVPIDRSGRYPGL